jgi:hypothetical protein
MGGAVSALVVFGVLVLIGSPIALSIRGTRPEWTGLAFESVVIGLVVELFVAIVLLHAGHYSPATALVLTAVLVAGATYAVRRAGARSGTPPADLSLLKHLEPGLIGLATLVLIGVALGIRHAPSYFIFQTGDMGGYVNSANILTRSGQPFGTSPQGFTLFLRETNLLLGKAHTVAGVPALGAILLLGVIAFARTLGLHVAAALAVAAVVVVHPVMVWFSLFPVSESLYAVLLLALLYLVVRARSTRSHSYAVMAGIVAGALLLVRGEAMLMAPILVLVMFASAVSDDDGTASVQRRFTSVALVTLFVSYAYDVHYTHLYFRAQLRHLLPGSLSRFAEDAHLEELSIVLVLAGALALALVLWANRWVSRRARPRVVDRPALFWRCACGAVIGLSVVALLFFRLAGLGDTWLRWGPVLLALCAIGAVAVALQPGKHIDAVCGVLLFLVIGVYTVLFARRVPAPKTQTYYLYFDRYLFSEVLPAALPLAAIGVQMLVDACTRVSSGTRAARIAIAGVVAIVLIGLVPQVHETRRVTRYRLLGRSYEAVHRLDELTRAKGAGAIVYSGSATPPVHWFYPNTFRAFAVPLRQSFDRQVFGVPARPLAKDYAYDATTAQAVLTRNKLTSGYLVSLRVRGRKRFPDSDHTHYLGTVEYACPILGQHTHSPAAPWEIAHLKFDVYALTA